MSKPIVITKPTKIEEIGDKIIEEYVGILNSHTKKVSIAHMYVPAGWKDIGQCPEFDEFLIVLKGMVHIEFKEGTIDVLAGQVAITHKGEWIRYGAPNSEGAEYISVCIPAFSPQKVHRDTL